MRSCRSHPPARLSSPRVFVRRMAMRPAWIRVLAAMTAAYACVMAPDAASAQAVDCPGAQPACPYVSSAQIGKRGGGVLRFPQTVAIGPDGNVYVGDQSS